MELSAAIRDARTHGASRLSWPGDPRRVEVTPPSIASSGFVTGTPIHHYVSTLTRAPATAAAARVPARVLHLCADAALAADVRSAAPRGARVLALADLDARDEQSLLTSLAALAPEDVDGVVVLARATDARAFLEGTPGSYRPVLRALFGAARRYYDAIARGGVAFAAVVLDAASASARSSRRSAASSAAS